MLKTISSITNALGALNYKGTWNASSNTPTLADGTGAKGDYYVVSTAGTQTFGGVQLFFGLGDWIAYNGAVWQRVEGGSDGNFANVTLTSTDAGATAAPLLDLYRDSATPAASDTLGEIEFNGEDSAGNKQAYALFHGSILSPTSGAEQGQLHFETATAGVLTEKMIIGTTNLVINEIGAIFNVRIEGDTDANLFYTDATNDKVGLGTASPAEKLDVVGKIKVSDNIVIGTSGKGIDFSATSGTGTSELLADYEEGVWTPALTSAGGNFTTIAYGDQQGFYTKVGRQVTVYGFLFTSGAITAGSASGQVFISGLPFAVVQAGIGDVWTNPDTANYNSPLALATGVTAGSSTLRLFKNGVTNNPAFAVTDLNVAGGPSNYIFFQSTYFV